MLKPGIFKHITCRNVLYPKSSIQRQIVPDDKIFWSISYEDYNPPNYTDPHVNKQIWADPQISESFKPQWNSLDGNVNRVSFNGEYEIINGYPINPFGRTG